MKWLVITLVVAGVLESIVAPPVTEKKKEEEDKEKADRDKQFQEMGIEYNRYLVQVVEALESDPEFRKKLENATSEEIQSGKIAEELDFVSHNVRTKLDELKRVELDRLRKLARQAYEQQNEIDSNNITPVPEPSHLDHHNPHTFEIADLKKLIAKTAEDLAEADKQRRDEFKTYEMEKEFEKQQKLKEMDEEKQKKYLEELEEQKKKHQKHEPLHHPGSKQQLEEVWEKQDHMENQEFDPKAFFFMHDLDGNGAWDESEVKALFLKELDKMYQAGAPEDDMRERAEEMERMREHVFKEADLNHDNLISFDEFLIQTQKPEFERDQGWEGLDEQQVYTQDEYREFERQRQEEVNRLIQEGKLQPPPVYHPPPPPGYYPPPPPPQAYNQVPVQQQVPYQQQAQAYQQQQIHQQQQHFQQQQQNNLKQQQQYQQQNPQHYQQEGQNKQFQQPQQQQFQNQPPQNQQFQQPQQQQFQNQPQQNQQFQQPQQQQFQNQPQQNQQFQQPQQQPFQNQPQQNQQFQQPQQQQFQNQPPQNQQFQQPQQQQFQTNQPSQQQQQLSNDIPQQPAPSNNIPQQQQPPLTNSVPQQNVPVMSNDIPKSQPAQGANAPPPPLPAAANTVPKGPK